MTITTKGRPLMVDDGYSYVKDRQTDLKTYWRCENHKHFNCHYRLHTCNVTNDILERKGTHVSNRNRDTTKLLLRKFDEKLNERATSTQETTDTILCQCLTSIPDTVRARLPALDHVKRKIRKRRQNHHLPHLFLTTAIFQACLQYYK
ncbi:unnamed protein product [Didymodactylos carnosus]|uniref:FLYWCH-type domain-containing protein n=1 Tax=Didymodactylos carnosus TaxID=1234261 RepID=A0A8S2UBD5_9BILA|nr:unnamed protein product [Didymodactylos carnosus]CAF4334662.1 unnamed protein product [Didymodactylos carnosus]